MNRTIPLLAALVGLVATAEARVALVLDDQLLDGVESVVYEPLQKQIEVTFTAGPRCSAPALQPIPGQLVLNLALQGYPVLGDIVYQPGATGSTLSIRTLLGPVECAADGLFFDRFEQGG
jgi:hypothetical protein